MLQERMARPSRCTVQHPHSPAPQPKRVPLSPSSSRNTHRSGVSGALSTWRRVPLTVISIIFAPSTGFASRLHALRAADRRPLRENSGHHRTAQGGGVRVVEPRIAQPLLSLDILLDPAPEVDA